MEIHEAAEIMPLDEEHIPDLAADIKANGLLDDIETLDGKVIDGRRRLRACEMVGVPPRFRAVIASDPVTYVLSKQNRRDLTPSQRAMIGARAVALREKLAASAKERQKRKPAQVVVEPVPQQNSESIKTRDQIGKLVGVTGRTVSDATKVLEKGIPDLAKAVDEGRMAVKTAAVLATEPEDVQRAEIANPKRNRKYAGASPKAKPKPPESASALSNTPSLAVSRAQEAIDRLRIIPVTDPRREEALRFVAKWIRNELKEMAS